MTQCSYLKSVKCMLQLHVSWASTRGQIIRYVGTYHWVAVILYLLYCTKAEAHCMGLTQHCSNLCKWVSDFKTHVSPGDSESRERDVWGIKSHPLSGKRVDVCGEHNLVPISWGNESWVPATWSWLYFITSQHWFSLFYVPDNNILYTPTKLMCILLLNY